MEKLHMCRAVRLSRAIPSSMDGFFFSFSLVCLLLFFFFFFVACWMGLYSEPFLPSASRRDILHQLYETADPRARARCSSCHLHHRHAQPVVLLDPPGALRTRHPRPRPGHGRGRYRLRRDGLSPVSSRSVRQEGGLDGPDGSREGGRHVLDRVSDGRDWASCQIQRAPPPPRPWKMAC